MQLTVIDPSTGEVIRELATADDDQVERTLDAASRAARDWAARSLDERAEVLRTVAATFRDREDDLATLMAEEMGKPLHEGRGEAHKAAWCSEHYAEHAASYLADQVLASDATRSYVRHVPLGTVFGVLPWNAPVWLASRVFAPALMAGNTVVVKHDAHVPATAAAIAQIFADVAPAGLYQDLRLDHDQAEAVIRDPRIHAVSFTGSERGGAAVSSIAASEIKPAVLELGGSDPVIVLADADLEQAADTITTSRIINAGQSCIAAKRVLVERAVHDEFVEMLRTRLAALQVGDPRTPGTQVGPIAREELRDELHAQVTRTVEAGATLVLGGEVPDGPGWFYPPTLLTGVEPGMAAFGEETFGPVAAVLAVDDADQAVELANATDYGLAASVWTADPAHGEQVALRLEAGQVVVNGIVKTDPRLPSGGIKRSGFGRELGPHGIHEFVNHQQVWIGPKVE